MPYILTMKFEGCVESTPITVLISFHIERAMMMLKKVGILSIVNRSSQKLQH